jgi:hypothetical protein
MSMLVFIHSFIHQWLYSLFLGPGLFFIFVIFFTQSVGLLGQGISPSQGLYLYTEQHKQNKRTQTSMSHVRFEPTIPAFERAKTVHVLDREATVIGECWYRYQYFQSSGSIWLNLLDKRRTYKLHNIIRCVWQWMVLKQWSRLMNFSACNNRDEKFVFT